MASNNRHQEIVADIEGQLIDIDQRLKALSPAEQKKLINEKREDLMGLARNTLANRGGIAALADKYAWIANLLLRFLGFDPFEWCYFEEYDHNARLANRAFSNPSLCNALAQAAQILEEKQSPHFERISEHFDEKVESVDDVKRVTDIIIGFCKCLRSARNGFRLLIDENDVKLLLMDCIKLLLEKRVSEERFEELHSNPLVLESGKVGWVKYKFVSNTYMEKGCFCDDKCVKLDVTIWYYCFSSEIDFRLALRSIERDN